MYEDKLTFAFQKKIIPVTMQEERTGKLISLEVEGTGGCFAVIIKILANIWRVKINLPSPLHILTHSVLITTL